MNFNTPRLRPINFWQFILANLILSVFILIFFIDGALHDVRSFMIGMVWAFLICTTQWIGPVIINKILEKRIKWDIQPVKRAILELLSLIFWSVTALIVVQAVLYYLLNDLTLVESWPFISRSIITAFLISLFISMVFTTVGFFTSWRKAVINEADLKMDIMLYRYESLRNQINPHFLFNSFNVLSDLVYDDQEKAVKFIRQLSDLFRYVLDNSDNNIVTIKEELEFMKAYIYLLKTRFNDKLNITINIDETDRRCLMPMTIQLLVENAVKHNEISDKYPLNIDIRIKDDYLEVENTLKLKNTVQNSKKLGHRTINQQLDFFTEKQLEVIQTEDTYLVRVPLI